MKRSIAAVIALIAGVAIAAPMFAATADEPQLAQAGPGVGGAGQPGMGDVPGMMGQMGRMQGGMEHHGMGSMGPHGWMGAMRQRMMQMSPRQRCEERLARRAGVVAYTVAKLNLTAEQKLLWDKLQSQLQAAADKQRQLCAGLKPADQAGQQTILDRVSQREQFLSARLQALQQARPALEQLYQALTAEQKAIVDHPFRQP